MGLFKSVKNFTKEAVDAPRWAGTSLISDIMTSLVDSIGSLIVPQKATYQESFEDMMLRFHFTEKDIEERIYQFQKLQIIFLILFFLSVLYFIYLLFTASFTAALICLGATFISFAHFFRYNFWLFQIKQRKLGCTFKEWWNHFSKQK